MGVGLSAQGVNMNRLPGWFNDLKYTDLSMCAIIFTNLKCNFRLG